MAAKISSQEQVVEAVRGATGPLSVRGAGTRGLAGSGTPLPVAGLSGITLYEPGALTMVAQAGTPVAAIEKALARENQRLAFEPMDHSALMGTRGKPTIGGVFAANVSGPRRISVGAARDFLLGVQFVDGRGRVIKNGGRVMKNVTGYDLVKLMAGSFGTLGVLTEVSFKVLPRVETQTTLVLTGLDDLQAVAAMSRAMGSPYEVTGAAHDPAAGETLLRLEGFEASVAYRADQIKALLALPQIDQLSAKASTARWAALRDVTAFQSKAGDVWRVSCKPTDAPALAARAGGLGRVYDWAGGLIWMLAAPDTDVRERLGRFDGHATLIRASDATKSRLGRFHPEAPGVARLTDGLRQQFDPKGLFSSRAAVPAQ